MGSGIDKNESPFHFAGGVSNKHFERARRVLFMRKATSERIKKTWTPVGWGKEKGCCRRYDKVPEKNGLWIHASGGGQRGLGILVEFLGEVVGSTKEGGDPKFIRKGEPKLIGGKILRLQIEKNFLAGIQRRDCAKRRLFLGGEPYLHWLGKKG